MDRTTTLADLRGQLENVEGYVRGVAKKAQDAYDKIHEIRMAGYMNPQPEDAKPAPVVELGEWRGWELTWHIDGHVYALTEEARKVGLTAGAGFKPGDNLAALDPELTNALLTAYRRAVERGLATWPEGWEWAKDEMPDDWDATRRVWLGIYRLVGSHHVCAWPDECPEFPGVSDKESRRRAALLGLCEAKPAPGRDVDCSTCEATQILRQQLAAARDKADRSTALAERLADDVLSLSDRLAAGNAEVAELTDARDRWRKASIADAAEVERLAVEVAEAVRLLREAGRYIDPKDPWCLDFQAWLARNAGANP